MYAAAGLNELRASRPGMQEYAYTRLLDAKSPARPVQGCRSTLRPGCCTQRVPRVPSRNVGIRIYAAAGLKDSRVPRLEMQEYMYIYAAAELKDSRASRLGTQEYIIYIYIYIYICVYI